MQFDIGSINLEKELHVFQVLRENGVISRDPGHVKTDLLVGWHVHGIDHACGNTVWQEVIDLYRARANIRVRTSHDAQRTGGGCWRTDGGFGGEEVCHGRWQRAGGGETQQQAQAEQSGDSSGICHSFLGGSLIRDSYWNPTSINTFIFSQQAKNFGNIVYNVAYSAEPCIEFIEYFLHFRIKGMVNTAHQTHCNQR